MKMWQMGLVVASGVVLAGCSHKTDTGMGQAPPLLPETANSGPEMVDSIADAMGLGKTMECVYKTGEGTQALESAVTVQGQKFRSTSLMNGVKSYALSDGEAIYIWSDANNQGMKMTQACLKDMEKNLPAGSSAAVPEDPTENFKMAKDVSCKEAGAADFSIPAAVSFADQCALFQQSLEMMKNLPTVPGGYGR